jgi:NAD(P)H-hydrate repair Nnr-like enzyme with NAD(P)H-hydrate dehydratase domain
MLAVVGTIPDHNLPLVVGEVTMEGHRICINGHRAEVNRGTVALLAAAIKTSVVLKQAPPFAFLAGDIGTGEGSRRLYKFLVENLVKYDLKIIVFHYLLPDADWFNRILFAIDEMIRRPVLLADAGGMYAAKMSGQAERYDLFTPDAGELAFLADEEAPHPFYTRGFILHEENSVPDLIRRAYAYNNASRYLLVKGRKDYIANREGIIATIDYPMIEALEPIGGTGDTLTGITSALVFSGIEIDKAAIIAAKVNRLSGYYACPAPATQVMEIIEHIPMALGDVLKGVS